MKRFLPLTVILTVMFLLCSNAYATHRSWNKGSVTQDKGFYIGASGGLNLLNDSSLDSTVTLDVKYGTGLTFGGVLGYDFGMVRLDAEVTYRDNDIDQIGFPADGSTSALSYMVNGYFDIPTHMIIKPYVGGGIGYATVSIDNANIPGIPPFPAPIADDSDSVLAYQLSAGIGFEISRATTLSLGYRYFATDDPEMIDASGAAFSTQYQSHEFTLGVRFLFN
jgi:opacity protein-like surface antigen